jgi:hypothetical protein
MAKKLIMPIIYLYISLFRRITDIFKNHTRNTSPEINAMYLISTYEIFIVMNFFSNSFITKKPYMMLFEFCSYILILVGNYYIFEKLYWKIEIPNKKIFKSKALLNTFFILLTIWFVHSFFSLTQKVPNRKDELKYYRPLPPNHPEADFNGQKFYYN